MELENIRDHIQHLELKLLQTDLTANPALIDDLLSDDFEEISSSGQINSRNDVINWLLNKDNAIQWALVDFRVKALSEDVVLAIYTMQKRSDSRNISKGSIRTSIWQRQRDHWKMVFHQASKIT